MVRNRGFISLWSASLLVLAFIAALAMPQAAVQAKEPFTFPTSDNETIPSTIGCPGGIAIDNGTININYFGERSSGINVWLYPNGYTNCCQEMPFMSFDAKLPQPLSAGTITQCYPLTGSPDTWYETIVDLDLDGGAPDVEVHRQIMVSSNENYFLAKYTINNIKGISMPNFRFFEGVDYDVASTAGNDEGGYDQGDFVWTHELGAVGTYVGFTGDIHSTHHDVNQFAGMWGDIVAGVLNDASYYNGDTGVALEWDVTELPAGGSASITVTFAFAPTFNELADTLFQSAPRLTVSELRSSPSSQTPTPRLTPAILSTQYARVTPQQAYANQPVTISTNVVNTGSETGNYNVILKVNGQVEQSKMVSVGPQGTQPVKFTVTKAQPGKYIATIDGQQASFIVLGSKTSMPSINGGLMALMLIGVLVLATMVVLILSFRRSA